MKMIKTGLILFLLASSVNAATNRPDGYTTICKVGETCTVAANTNVAFGASGLFVYKVLSGSFVCSVDTFGSDPIPWKDVKECSIDETAAGTTQSSDESSGGVATAETTSFSGESGRYKIISRFSGKAIDVEGKGTANGTNILLWEYKGALNQQWDIESLGGGYYSIRAAHSGKAMDVYNFCSDPGCQIYQWEYWGGENQQWQITGVGDGYYKIVSRHNNMPIDVWGKDSSNGADLRQYTDTNDTNQQWEIVAVDGVTTTPDESDTIDNDDGSDNEDTADQDTVSGDITGSTCNGGNTTVVTATIRVEDGGTFDGGCNTYTAGSELGDGSQDEGQDPIFRVGPGLIRNVYIGSNGADGIHTRNGGDVENIHWSDVGEDAMTIKSPTDGATVTATNVEAYDSADKFLQANDDGTWIIDNCIVSNAGKFLRQNGGTTFPLHVEVSNCDISDMGEGIFRSDSSNSTARITNSRLHNAGDICIGSWKSCTSSGITYY
jgi:pectate lyase C